MNCSGPAIRIVASDVDLNFGSHTIAGDGSGDGVQVLGVSNVKIHHGTIQNIGTGIDLIQTVDNKVTDLTVTGNSWSGIAGVGIVDSLIAGNTLTQNADFGMFFAQASCGNRIERNTATENGDFGLLLVDGACNNTIARNNLIQNGAAGLGLVDAVDNSVTDNTANGHPSNGFYISNSIRNTFVRNSLDRNGSGMDIGDDSHDNIVSRNTFTGNTYGGVGLRDGATQNLVENNTMTGNGGGISMFTLSTGPGASSNTVQNNTIDGNDSGINVVGQSHANTIVDNLVKNCKFHGIGLYDGATQNLVQGNIVLGCNSAGVALFSGPLGQGASENRMIRNAVNANARGIQVETNSTNNRVQDNTALNNTFVDLEDGNPNCDSNSWSHNRFLTDSVVGVSDSGPGTGCIQ